MKRFWRIMAVVYVFVFVVILLRLVNLIAGPSKLEVYECAYDTARGVPFPDCVEMIKKYHLHPIPQLN